MSSPDLDFELEDVDPADDAALQESSRYDRLIVEGEKRYKLTGMYKEWFLDYASYVILERAVPHIDDGLKPVQRRILHAMKRMDDGRYNKVANIIGFTMQYHPHGDASIGDALVQLGQKDILIDCQGNWGNILTGDSAAAPRYIEARLTKFANEVVFNPKTTKWMRSYDGRNQEPVTLPVKFPLLLAQGVEGIAVGLTTKILPHNFNELIEASIACLNNKEFTLYPDFPTGGLADCSRYNRGLRGGIVKVRAKITKLDKRTLSITELPYGQTTSKLIESILKANDKGKIKIRKVDDNTSEGVEIVVHLQNDISPDKTIDALYAFTDCETSLSLNSCVIKDNHPCFTDVDEILRHNTEMTMSLLRQELEIRLGELREIWHNTSLEKIFFEQRIYRLLEKDAASWDNQIEAVHHELLKYRDQLKKDVERDDVLRLVEKPVRKISSFDIKQLEDSLAKTCSEMEEVQNNLTHLTAYTIRYYTQLKKRYGSNFPRKTELANFEVIEATKVVATNAKLYANRAEGFVGMDLKKDENAEFICECSDIDDIIVFLKSGKYKVIKISEKVFVGKDIIYVGVFKKNDERCIYNTVYKNGKGGGFYVKRFAVTGATRDKEYDLTQGKEGSQVIWFTANSNGEAEVLKVFLKPRPKLKKLIFEFDFSQLAIKGRGSMGNILSKNPIHKIQLKSAGVSQFGGQPVWFDTDINRLNIDNRGQFLGEFLNHDHILVLCKSGEYYTTNYDLSNRYQGELIRIEKLDPHKVYTAIYFDGELGCFYVKRFSFEPNDNIVTNFISDSPGSYLHSVSYDLYPQIEITFSGKNAKRATEYIDVDEFIGVKSFRAKGKRLTTFEVGTISFTEPLLRERKEEVLDTNGEESEKPGNVVEETGEEEKDISPTLF
ncbi:MAG: DNA gyrase/topoisomerase IV subunit A [Bacteroidales bacterium]|nr:DNA gyrase/topoisomerase IV subunit A [Bacteroidales bacterium]MDD3989032.1 DNA gyrase/topoisomerase IV subunit A [Bacteroidales bacterium]MDD4638775.1 DNA gyrase/topoisomerase IV subunit A [Bacteroidales bacterium]